VDERVGVQLKL